MTCTKRETVQTFKFFSNFFPPPTFFNKLSEKKTIQLTISSLLRSIHTLNSYVCTPITTCVLTLHVVNTNTWLPILHVLLTLLHVFHQLCGFEKLAKWS
uniref:Uncharacterized protein n=1 Tax=Physcomitrium patens TaxID=3218 RepID=A0A2K1IX14_PHYPA|nr:hypothetical protein PHYPA_023635 [Physcomitrium patens]